MAVGERVDSGTALSQSTDHARGAVPARRRDRRDRAHHPGQHVAIARPANRDREHRRCRPADPGPPPGPRRAPRLHGAAPPPPPPPRLPPPPPPPPPPPAAL